MNVSRASTLFGSVLFSRRIPARLNKTIPKNVRFQRAFSSSRALHGPIGPGDPKQPYHLGLFMGLIAYHSKENN